MSIINKILLNADMVKTHIQIECRERQQFLNKMEYGDMLTCTARAFLRWYIKVILKSAVLLERVTTRIIKRRYTCINHKRHPAMLISRSHISYFLIGGKKYREVLCLYLTWPAVS